MNNILSLSQIGNYFSLNCACALILYGILDVVQETESTLLEDRVSSYRFLSLTRSDESNKKHIHTYINTYINTYIHTYIHIYLHTYIHTYIKSNSGSPSIRMQQTKQRKRKTNGLHLERRQLASKEE